MTQAGRKGFAEAGRGARHRKPGPAFEPKNLRREADAAQQLLETRIGAQRVEDRIHP